MNENKEKARLRRAQRAALMNGAREQTITGTYNDKMQALAGLSEPWSNAACMGYCLMAMRQAGVPGRKIRFLQSGGRREGWTHENGGVTMERYVIVIPADEEQKARLVRCDDGDTCKLETLQTLVGGPIETAESCFAANWAREDVDSIQLIVNEEGLLQELPFNERATDLYQYRYMSGIVGTAALMAARGEELIGFAKPVSETICSEWNLELEETGEECHFQTFSPD